MTWPVGTYHAFLISNWKQMTSQVNMKKPVRPNCCSTLSALTIKIQYNSWSVSPKPTHCPTVLKDILALPRRTRYQNAKPFQVVGPKWHLPHTGYLRTSLKTVHLFTYPTLTGYAKIEDLLAITISAKCSKFGPLQINPRLIHKETLNAVWLL